MHHKKHKSAKHRGMQGQYKPQKVAGNATEGTKAGIRRKAQKGGGDWE